MKEQQKITSGDSTLERLVVDAKYVFRVTNYQRHYVWTEKEVNKFLADGEFCWREEKEGKEFIHFAGQMSLRTIRKENDFHTTVEIVDGQQRMTTFLLLIAVAARMMRTEYGQESKAKELKEKYFVARSEFREDEWRLELSHRDNDFWKELTGDYEKKSIKTETESKKHLLKAEKTIDGYLKNLTAGKEEEEAAKILQEYVKAIASSFRVVLLETSSPGYAYALYQTVNDRGVPLTSGELLKARTIELLSDRKELADRAERIWDDILDDSGTVTNRYLSWNYTAVTGKRMESRGNISIHEQYERDIFHCYNKRILSGIEQRKVIEQVELLYVNVARMRALSGGMIPEQKISEQTRLLFECLIVALKNTFCIPLYLKILEMREDKIAKTLDTVTPMLAKAFFIAKTMGGLHDAVIANCYLEIWKCIDRNHADTEGIKGCLEKLIKRDNCSKEFASKIKDDVYARGSSANGKAKFLLIMLELYYLMNTEAGGRECGDDSFRIHLKDVSIEHILRESIDPNEVSKAFFNSLHKIGNLTLMGKKKNTRLKDADFEKKRLQYQNSPYYITREVGKLEQWKKADFDERQKRLTEDLQKAFQL